MLQTLEHLLLHRNLHALIVDEASPCHVLIFEYKKILQGKRHALVIVVHEMILTKLFVLRKYRLLIINDHCIPLYNRPT